MFSFIVLFGAIIGTIYLALMYSNEAIMLLAFMEAAFFLVSLGFIIYRKTTLKAIVNVPIGISETGKENLVRIEVANKSPIPVGRMKAFVTVKNTVTGEKEKAWMKVAGTHDEKTVFVQSLVFQRAGNYEITLDKLRIYEMTGLLYGTMKTSSSGRIQVMPKMHDVIVRLTSAVKNFYGETEVYDEHNAGQDNSEIYDVREYRDGDRLQNVHWKMTAKQDELMVKENSLPKSCPVILVLDFDVRKAGNKKDRGIHYAEVVASLSFSMMDAGCPHYVAWYDETENDIIRVRVDDEESMFYFIGMLMNIRWTKVNEDVVERYRDKYKAELYVWLLSINERFELKKGEELLAQIDEKKLEESLSQVELLL